MLAVVMTVLHLIPGLSSLATGWLTAAYNAKVAITTAQIGGDVTVATAIVNASAVSDQTRVKGLQVIAGSWVLSFLTLGFACPWIFYEAKVVVWDTCLGLGSTPAIHGAVIDWATTIITCLFGSGTVLTAGHMYFNRNSKVSP
jgi:hypothetical protein